MSWCAHTFKKCVHNTTPYPSIIECEKQSNLSKLKGNPYLYTAAVFFMTENIFLSFWLRMRGLIMEVKKKRGREIIALAFLS